MSLKLYLGPLVFVSMILLISVDGYPPRDVFSSASSSPDVLVSSTPALSRSTAKAPPDHISTAQRGRDEDPINLIYTALLEKAGIVEFSATEIPKDAFSDQPFEDKKAEDGGRDRPREKIHPVLQRLIAERPGNERELIVINFRDKVQIPRFPEPATEERRESPANKEILIRTAAIIEEIAQLRAREYAALAKELEERFGAKVLETFWLIKGMLVEIPLGAVKELAARDDVLFLEPERPGEEPPQNGNNNDDVDDARRSLVSDPYFNLGLTGGWIGLLDTGLRFSHTLFNQPSHIDFRRDCVNGGANCNDQSPGSGFNPNDDCWNHGTSSAGIITGNVSQGNAFRGVTAITLDSFKVYPTSFDGGTGRCDGGLSTTASIRGFQTALAVLDRVIVAEMQSSGNDTSSISSAADNAFDAGAVVIAANGNNGPGAETVNAPAIAHKVIGVGNFDVQTANQINSQSRGASPDNRYKPDIQAPTNSETASNGCGFGQNCTVGGSDFAFRSFSGTSGSTPYAAGVAALLRNWLRGASFSIDPGQVYAMLILSGQNPYPFNNTRGAGPLRLPTNGWAWWGKVVVADGQTIDIPLTVSGAAPNTFDGALWWPETASGSHNDIDLYLIDPGGAIRDLSWSIPSVFERARVDGAVAPGVWKLRVRGFRVRTGVQTVYWMAHVRLR